MEMPGVMFRAGGDEEKHLLCFTTNPHRKKALYFIAGMNEGFMSLPWLEPLSRYLDNHEMALVQVNLGSSWSMFGGRMLDDDAHDLDKIIQRSRRRYGFHEVVLMGHSTGAQILLAYMTSFHSPVTEESEWIKGLVLHGPVSDRQANSDNKTVQQMQSSVEKMMSDGRGKQFLPVKVLGVPMSAERFHSLFIAKKTHDDVFSSDGSPEELPVFRRSPTKFVGPAILMFHGVDDEYVPDRKAAKKYLEKLGGWLGKTDLVWLPGDHASSKCDAQLQLLTNMSEWLEAILPH